jgi:dephospho-CoA kinase
VASGKSRVAHILVDLGAGLVDADRAGHAVLAEDADVQRALRERWGDAVFAADGKVDRRAVARLVFGEGKDAEAQRRFLEGLVHPQIGRRLAANRDRLVADGKQVVVVDAALLFEANWRPMCDVVLFVDTPRDVRLERARKRGWSEADFAWREAAQWPVEEKKRHADAVISNAGTEAELREAVDEFWKRFVAPVRRT